MRILVIDGQGGRLGKEIIKLLKERIPQCHITAVGTNLAATSAMLKGGADEAATGENPVVVASRKTDVIVGPIGIVIADSLLGEITPKMAEAIAKSDCVRVLIPMNRCDNLVAGVKNQSVEELVCDAVDKIMKIEVC